MLSPQTNLVVRRIRLCLGAFCFALAISACNTAPIRAPAPPTKQAVLTQERAGTTPARHRFVIPAGWTETRRKDIVILEAPEKGAWIAFADVVATEADTALSHAWALYRDDKMPALLSPPIPLANHNGWQDLRGYRFKVPVGESRQLTARAMRRGDVWAVRIDDLSSAVTSTRPLDLSAIRDSFLPAGYVRETFAGRNARRLDPARLKELTRFVEAARETLEVPGIAIGIVQDGETLFEGGFGVRELGKPGRIDADTLFPVASNSKPLTSLMIAKLIDEGKLNWETRVVDVLPQFRLADSKVTADMKVKHLLCACAGLPNRNVDWQFAPAGTTATIAFDTLARMTPSGALGTTYSYTNPPVSAGGLLAGHIVYPDLGLIEAYEAAMDSRVFRPLGMKRSTFDPNKATRDNFARTYGGTVAGERANVDLERDKQFRMIAPAGGAWSNVKDLLAYVRMELSLGLLDDGSRYISEAALKSRTEPQVRSGTHTQYGLGLETSTAYGTLMVFHGGRSYGFRGDIVWLPAHGVGMVILMNSNSGNALMDAFPRKVLELLFDGEQLADSMIVAAAAANRDQIILYRENLKYPPEPSQSAVLAARYRNEILGELRVSKSERQTLFSFENWNAPVAARTGPSDEIRFIVTAAGPPFAFVAAASPVGRTLTLREGPTEFIFTEVR
jgi:CubicO group peptidase (beta-lactamase class C family)